MALQQQQQDQPMEQELLVPAQLLQVPLHLPRHPS
jgi:hypothetical protein